MQSCVGEIRSVSKKKLVFFKFHLYVKVVDSSRSRCSSRGGGGGDLRRVGPAPKTDQKCKSKDKHCFHLSNLVV